MDITNKSAAKTENEGKKVCTLLYNCVDTEAPENNVTITKNYDDLATEDQTKFDEFATWLSALT